LIPNWNHALSADLDDEAWAWLDAHLKGGAALPAVGALKVVRDDQGSQLQFEGSGPRPLSSAEVLVSAGEAGHWASRCWSALPAVLTAGVARVTIPASRLPLWVSGSVVDASGFRASTAIATIAPSASASAVPACDGAAAWGDFELPAEAYLKRQGVKVPEWSTQSAHGQRSAQLSGKASFPLFYTAGLAHRFSCRVRSEQAAQINVRLAGRFDGTPLEARGSFPVAPKWSEVVLELTPPQSASGTLAVHFDLPPGVSILLDDAAFRPVP
jgi:hypothetical protein